MSKARKIVEYFNKSTQQTSKLLNFQKESILQSIVDMDFAQRSYFKMLLQGGGHLIAC
jgi:hypothetical protein